MQRKTLAIPSLITQPTLQLQSDTVPTILRATRVRNELTHRKTWGYETYEDLDAISLDSLRIAVVDVCIAGFASREEPYPY